MAVARSSTPPTASPAGGSPESSAASASAAAVFPSPFPCEIVERRSGAKPLVVAATADDGGKEEEEERPWVGIARRVEQNLVASARSAREELDAGDGNAKLSFVARVGKVLFHGDPSTCLNSIRKAAVAEEGFKNRVHKSFYTNVPNEFMKNVEQLIVKSIGFDFESEREHYHVKVFDKHQPDSTISCKCTVRKDGGLELYKIELNQVRHMVVDISCLHKDLDLRLILVTKKLLKNLDDEVENGINQLISSAIIDSEVKGGLRWPFGKESVAERFSVVGVWLTRYKAYRSKTMRLKLRHADRFDHKTSTGEVANEVTLKLSAISELLREGNLEETPVGEMLEATVKLVWEKFLSYSVCPALPS
ncbi:uncharacterized protein LOC109726120 isoform X1 [Ananas comosus]|uniref:Uncharacterized protein LOC109726120 isoform X1 n=1 Tax=Ananas comosus TaxID=4615 RepID=A0A6P5GZG0_ANACO|nr:uncharacterized protein LOC109726120 isoform X1 [Ananas comosus]